ncbi:MAG: hypothetical protein SGPRY_001677, partial [Prymnesium sp.]
VAPPAGELRWWYGQQNSLSSPWLFAHAGGRGARSKGQLQARSLLSAYLQRDSPLPPEAGEGLRLTGTAWHSAVELDLRNSSSPASPASVCKRLCGPRAVCTAPLADALRPLVRCDCAPYAWGEGCSLAVTQAKRRCVHNDSRPWNCDHPACIFQKGEVRVLGGSVRTCTGAPLSLCPLGCSGRGSCVRATRGRGREALRCSCFYGFGGEACELSSAADCVRNCTGHGECLRGFCLCTPPYTGVDCSVNPARVIRCSMRPCVYVYDLPARMNVLSRKSYASWRSEGDFKYRAPMLMLESLLDSPYRTADSREADFFYVPMWEWEGCWGSNQAVYRAHRYISTVFPFWNRSFGIDHIWFVARDAGSCDTAWGSMRDELGMSIVVQHWGGATSIDGHTRERCFQPGQDIVAPASVRSFKTLMSPFWRAEKAALPRTTQLFFFGALCWRTHQRVSTIARLIDKCNKSMLGGGRNNPVARYAFGHRFHIWERYRKLPGYKLHATDYLSSVEGKLDVNREMILSKFCLSPSGSGWGMRAVHSIIMGCVPVVVQHDGVNTPVWQPFDKDLLDWNEFAVIVRYSEVDQLDRILEQTNLTRKQEGLRHVWTRMIWRRWLPEEQRDRLPGPDAFDTIMRILRKRLKQLPNLEALGHQLAIHKSD